MQRARHHLPDKLSTMDAVAALKAAAEPTRLRILMLLAGGELNVSDFARILGQSQPRISRHLKLLNEAGLIERFKEGSWVYFQLAAGGGARPAAAALARHLVDSVDGAGTVTRRDAERADALKLERQQAAQTFFAEHAARWDSIRSLYLAEAEVEAAMLAALGDAASIGFLVDIGTGTGRILELFAGRYARALGLDVNQSMLAYARSKLAALPLSAANVQVRHGDLYHLPLGDRAADTVIMHQVLHFLTDPAAAIREAARILAPGGRLLIVDFAPHTLDFLRETYAHERLGFASATVEQWLREAGLSADPARELAPPVGASGDMLTVSLWVARRAPGQPTRSATRPLEAAS